MQSIGPEGQVFDELCPENKFGIVLARETLNDVKLHSVIPSNHENVCDDDAWDDASEAVVYFDRVVRDVEFWGYGCPPCVACGDVLEWAVVWDGCAMIWEGDDGFLGYVDEDFGWYDEVLLRRIHDVCAL